MTDTIDVAHFDDFLAIASQQPEPQRLLVVLTRRELPDGYTDEMKRRFDAGQGGHLAPVACVSKAPEEIKSFQWLCDESVELAPDWDVLFIAALAGNLQPPAKKEVDKALDHMVENIRMGSVNGFLAFNPSGDPLVLNEGDPL